MTATPTAEMGAAALVKSSPDTHAPPTIRQCAKLSEEMERKQEQSSEMIGTRPMEMDVQ